ncbi:MAG: hypothetical protein ABFS42_03675 [Candidatus Krumholzibacteriota bacterium]
MNGKHAIVRVTRALALTAVVVILAAALPGQARAGSWFKVAGGVSGMAMDDINNQDFRFYDYTIEGFNFPDLDAGFSLSFHLGYDLSPAFSLGFSWDRQYARVDGTDQDVTADLNLDANFFMGHLYWRALHVGKFDFGAVAGMGPAFAAGKVRLTGANNVNYGQGDTTGSAALALEFMGLMDFAVGESTIIEVTVGWRDATVKDVKYEGRPALKDDGSALALDYTGYIVKAGLKYVFAE